MQLCRSLYQNTTNSVLYQVPVQKSALGVSGQACSVCSSRCWSGSNWQYRKPAAAGTDGCPLEKNVVTVLFSITYSVIPYFALNAEDKPGQLDNAICVCQAAYSEFAY